MSICYKCLTDRFRNWYGVGFALLHGFHYVGYRVLSTWRTGKHTGTVDGRRAGDEYRHHRLRDVTQSWLVAAIRYSSSILLPPLSSERRQAACTRWKHEFLTRKLHLFTLSTLIIGSIFSVKHHSTLLWWQLRENKCIKIQAASQSGYLKSRTVTV